MRWMDNLALLLCPARFLLGGWEWPNMLAASLYIVFCRSSHSVKELQFFSLLYTISSSCAQRSSFALPQAIGVFTLKPSRSFFSLVRCELVVWVFSWLVFNILSFTASQEEISSRTNLTILHKSSSGHIWFRWCWNRLVEVEITTKFRRYVIKMWIQNDGYNKCTGHKKVHPRLPGTWDKALDFCRFAKSAKIPLRLIYLISHSSIGTYRGLRSGSTA